MSILNKDYVLIKRKEYDCLKSNDSCDNNSFVSCDYNDCPTLLANLTTNTKNTCILPTYNFANPVVQSNVTTQQQTDLVDWLCVTACIADFSVSTLAQAQQVVYNLADTICISNTKYKAVDVGTITGYTGSPPSVSNNDFFYIHTDPDTAIYRNTTSGSLPFYSFNKTDGNGYNAFGQLLIDNGFIYLETAAGGSSNLGTVLKIEIATGTATKLLDFTNATGFTTYTTNPTGNKDKVIINGKLYLNCAQGGANNLGTVLEIDITTGVHSVIYDTTGVPSGLSFSKGLAVQNGNDYVLIMHNVLFVYDTVNQTNTATTLFTSTTNAVNDFHLLGTDLYILYNAIARLIRLDLTTYTLTLNQRLDLLGFTLGSPTVLFYDSVNNKIFCKSFNAMSMVSYNILANSFTQDTTHSGMILPANTTVSKTQVANILYITSGNTNLTQQYIMQYDIVNKTTVQAINTQGSTFVPDGINFLEVNQAPIYLEKI